MEQIIQRYNRLFWDFVNTYDTNNSNILRKIIHSFSVADTCFAIACKFRLNEKERNFSYLLGLFHDLGRFEQWKQYQTYNDRISVDHGDLSCEIIKKFDEKDLYLTKDEKHILCESIKFHTKPYKRCNDKISYYSQMIKNADAYSNVITTANGAQQNTYTKTGYNPQLLEDFKNLNLLTKYCCETKLERCLMITACLYYVRLDFLKNEIIDRGYIDICSNTFVKYLEGDEKDIYLDAVNCLKSNFYKNSISDFLINDNSILY